MNRRTFLQNTAITAGGLTCLPGFLSAKEKEEIILGHNNKRYRIDTKWGQLDFTRFPVKDCHEMVQDSRGRLILLTNETKNNIIIYDKKGKLLTTWGNEYPGGHGLSLFNENGTEVLFICDNNRHQVIKTTLDGKVLMTLDYPKETGAYSKAEEYIPTETTIAPNGDIYVVDGYGKDFIIHYNYKGEYVRHWGGRGSEEKHLQNAHGICFDNRQKDKPVLIVTSREQNAFKRYTLNGEYIDTIRMPGAWVCRPVIRGEYLYAAVLQSQNMLWKESGFVTILDKNNKVVSNPGGSEPTYANNQLAEMSQSVKAFKYPHDVCVDDEENLYVAQWNSGNVYPYKLMPVT